MSKTILITGGSGGIGRACARLLIDSGHRVILVARGQEGLDRVAAELPADRVCTIAADVTKEVDVLRMRDEALAWAGRLDVLVNNAGVAAVGPVEGFSLQDWHRVVDGNLTSVFLCCKTFVPVLKGGGLIVNMGSVASKHTSPGWGPYCATKFALVGLSRCLQDEVRKDGVRVSLLFPAGVDTPLWDTFENDFNRASMLRPDDVARGLRYVIEQPREMVVDEVWLTPSGGLQ